MNETELIATIIGNNIKQQREKKKMTQEEVAKKAGIERSSYTKMELGTYVPRIVTLIKVAYALDVKVNKLLKGIEKQGF